MKVINLIRKLHLRDMTKYYDDPGLEIYLQFEYEKMRYRICMDRRWTIEQKKQELYRAIGMLETTCCIDFNDDEVKQIARAIDELLATSSG